MATPAYDFALVSPFDAIFTNGERIIGVSTTLGGASAGTYNLSRWFNLEKGGVFNLKYRATGATVIKTGASKAGLATIFSAPANTTVQTQIYVPPGEFRLDIHLTHTSGNCGVCFLMFLPDEVIYASAKAGWVFEASTVPDDNELTTADDPRLALPVFSVLPNWANGILERVSYLTDVMASETAAEQSASVRAAPRRQFDVQFMRHDVQRAHLDSFMIGVGRGHFLMPLFHEQYRPSVALESGDNTVDFPSDTLALREFMEGDLMMVTDGDMNVYEIVEVTDVDLTTDRVTFSPALDLDWPVGARVMPMRIAFIADKTDFSHPTDRVATMSLRFELAEPDQRFGASWGYCSPLWRFPVDWSQNVQTSHERATYTLDNQSAPLTITDPGERAFVSERVSVLLRGREDVVNFRRFIAAANGRAERFYFPNFTKDIEPVGDIEGDLITVKAFGFAEHILGQKWPRTWIGIVMNDGSPTIYRRVEAMGRIDSKTELLELHQDVPPIYLSKIARIQFIVPSRFDQDTFEFQHYVDEAKAVRTSVSTRSVDGTGMSDIECWTTSRIYPLESVDSISPSFVLDGGSLVVGLITYNEESEGLDITFGLDAGELT